MKDYIEEHQNIFNPYATNREYVTGQAPDHLLSSPKPPQPREDT